MRNASPFSSLPRAVAAGALLAGALVFAGCSSGSGDDASTVRIKCIGGQAFCIISCDLGCTQTGCAVSEIAENQRLRFKFSDRVDPTSVNGASLSIRTGTGVAPDGDYLVTDNEVTFVPKVRTVNGVSTFGFLRNETYIVSLAGGSTGSQGIRSLAGDPLTQEFTCTVRATLGIQDEDQQPPTVELLAPTNPAAVPLDPTIVLRFSELIDTAPLLSPLSESSPIRVVLRPTLPTGECDRDAESVTLEGLPQLSTETVGTREVTVVTFRPSVTLPGRSCLIVAVTSDLRDLSGRASVPASFELITVEGVSVPLTLTETFATPAGQEELVSGGVWNNGARPGLIGGDGRHGSFNPAFGTSVGPGVFVWDLRPPTGIVIPASNTPSGQSFTVLDGRFFFTDFVLAEGQTLRFLGQDPPRIFVRGRCEIRGTIDLSAPDMPGTPITTGPFAGQLRSTFNARGTLTGQNLPLVLGQPGGQGGCGGGSGGAGGTECGTLGPVFEFGNNVSRGQPGGTVRVPASHAYAGSAGGTGGPGSPVHHETGTALSVGAPFIASTSPSVNFRDEFSRGGGGGGFLQPGGLPIQPTIPAPLVQPNASPVQAPAAAFALFPLPSSPPPGYQSLDHFVVGGSGGGGGGSHAFATVTLGANDVFMAGHGGSGGGGTCAFRAGGDLTLFGTAAILLRGGRGVLINGDNTGPTSPALDVDWGVSSPGGGGSGGSVLLQSARTVTVSGLIDASGGAGSRVGGVGAPLAPAGQLNVTAQAGAGSPGFYRLEGGTTVLFNGPGTTVPTFDPAQNVGTLTDRDAASGDLSKWRGFNQVFPPTWLRYELDVDTNGDGTVDVTFTDSGEPGTQKANDPSGPVTIQFQGAKLNQAGNAPLPGTIKPWREGIGTGAGPGIQQDAVTGFRFSLSYNRVAAPNQVVKALRVFART
jgi:hypothetical protein